MLKSRSHKLKPDPARQRYPEALAGLLALGEPADTIDYAGWATRLAGYAADLIRMVLDDDLNQRFSDDPAVWAPIHALRILAIQAPAEAAEPLLACMEWDSDWFDTELPHAYGHIGPVAIPLLTAYLADAAHDEFARGRASRALGAIAALHSEAREQVIEFLTDFLDRPTASASAVEEAITAGVISDLVDLKATTAYEAIRRAFEQDRVDTQIIALEDVERKFDMRPPLDFSKPPEPRQEPGVRLVLKCKACGREREHLFPKVYLDMGTANDEKKQAKYSPVIIPQRVTCPKCGAVDQYELSGMGYLSVMADLLALRAPDLATGLREDQRVQPLTFTTRWGPMHPQEAIERYQRELVQQPNDVALRIGFGNVLRFLGRDDQADAEYQVALRLDPDEPDIWVNLAQLAGRRRDSGEAIRCWEKVRELAGRRDLPPDERELLADAAAESLAELRRGIFPDFDAPMFPDPSASPPQPIAPAAAARPKVGRNEPCPCGSGRKYKHCHGRKV